MFSSRLNWDLRPNSLTALLERKRAAGATILDLTESNPTHAGFEYPTEEILAALADQRALHYNPDPRGLASAREAIAADYARQGRNIAPDQILITSSTSEAYAYLLKLLCDPGDEILTPRPSYPLFEFLAALESVNVRQYPLRYDGAWHIDFAALEAAITNRTRAIVVVNPNNPTGSYLKPDEFTRLQSIAPANPAGDGGDSSRSPDTRPGSANPAGDGGDSSRSPDTRLGSANPAGDGGDSSRSPDTRPGSANPAGDGGDSSRSPDTRPGSANPAGDGGDSSRSPDTRPGSASPAGDGGDSSRSPDTRPGSANPAGDGGDSSRSPDTRPGSASPAGDGGDSSRSPDTRPGSANPAGDGGDSSRSPDTRLGSASPAGDGGDSSRSPDTRLCSASPDGHGGDSSAPPLNTARKVGGSPTPLPILIDEVFLTYPLHTPPLPPPPAESLTFYMSGLSKMSGLPQLKLGWIAADGPGHRAALDRLELIADTYLSVATPVQLALPRLLAAGESVRAQIRERTQRNLATLRSLTHGTSCHVLNLEGGWSATLHIPRTRTEESLVISLLADHNVLVQPGFFFDFESEAFLIVSLLPHPTTFDQAVRQLIAVIA